MGSKESRPEREEIIVQQQQQQQQSPSPAIKLDSGIGPDHIVAACCVILLLALAARFIWKLVTREIEIRSPRRADSVATIV